MNTVLFGAVLAVLVVFCYALVARFASAKSTAERTQPPLIPEFWRFSIRNQFEVDNVWSPIFIGDEYGVRKTHFEPDDVVVDVGAHIGTLSYIAHIRGSREIYCYEASEQNFELLQRNLSRLPGIHLFNRAVWRSDGGAVRELVISGANGANTGANSVMAGGLLVDFGSQTVSNDLASSRVKAVPLDEILASFLRVKLLKLDCEGSEFPILLTSRELHKVERIVAEVHEVTAAMMNALPSQSRLTGYREYRLQDLIACLESAGFQVSTRQGSPRLHLLDAVRCSPGQAAS
jgi:FkbM family methyltransferase